MVAPLKLPTCPRTLLRLKRFEGEVERERERYVTTLAGLSFPTSGRRTTPDENGREEGAGSLQSGFDSLDI